MIEHRTITIAEHNIHYLAAGTGQPVVLLHGGASDSRDWPPLMASLADHFSFYAPDIIGFGQSQRNGDGYYLSDFIDFIEEFIISLGLERPCLIGHSLGGRLALGLTLKRPDLVRKIVLVDAAGLGKTSVLGLVLVTFFNKLRDVLGRPQPAPQFRGREGEDRDWACLEALPDIRVPTLLVWKRHDPYLPLSNARQALQLIPDARLEVFPGIGHAPHRGHMEAFGRLVTDFFEGASVEKTETVSPGRKSEGDNRPDTI